MKNSLWDLQGPTSMVRMVGQCGINKAVECVKRRHVQISVLDAIILSCLLTEKNKLKGLSM